MMVRMAIARSPFHGLGVETLNVRLRYCTKKEWDTRGVSLLLLILRRKCEQLRPTYGEVAALRSNEVGGS
jgi:hypothetical protein